MKNKTKKLGVKNASLSEPFAERALRPSSVPHVVRPGAFLSPVRPLSERHVVDAECTAEFVFLLFQDSNTKNEIFFEPSVQIKIRFHGCASHVEIYKTRSHIDRF